MQLGRLAQITTCHDSIIRSSISPSGPNGDDIVPSLHPRARAVLHTGPRRGTSLRRREEVQRYPHEGSDAAGGPGENYFLLIYFLFCKGASTTDKRGQLVAS